MCQRLVEVEEYIKMNINIYSQDGKAVSIRNPTSVNPDPVIL